MIFRQFCTADADVSYLLADPVTRYAALLDPHVDVTGDYADVIRRLDLRLSYVLETHVHESHPSAAPALRAETGARLIAHVRADMVCIDRHVVEGDRIFMGEECLSVMETPGHSDCSVSYRWRDRVFTGHSLLVGATGSCRREDADAGRLFDSVRQRLFTLPGETLVCPGRVTGGGHSSSIAAEMAANAELQPHTTRDDFVAAKRAQAADDDWRGDRLAANRRCGISA